MVGMTKPADWRALTMTPLELEAEALLAQIDADPRVQVLQTLMRVPDAKRVEVTMRDGQQFAAERTDKSA